MKNFVYAILCLFIAACSTTKVVPVPGTLEGVKGRVEIDASLLEGCDKQIDLNSNVRPSDVLDQHAEDVKVLNCWISKHKALANTVKKAFNLEK